MSIRGRRPTYSLHWLWPLALALLAGWGSERAGMWRAADRWSRDHAVTAAARAAPESVLIVAIDDASLQRLGPWPWSRSWLARATDRLTAAGAHTIVLSEPLPGRENDLALRELQQLAAVVATDPNLARHPELPAALSRSYSLLDTDTDLARSLATHRRSLLAQGGGVPMAPQTSQTLRGAVWAQDALAVVPDADGVLRRHALASAGSAPNVAPSLVWLTALAQSDADALSASNPVRVREPLTLAGRPIALDAALQFEPLFARNGASASAFMVLPAHELLNPARVVPRLDGKLVLIGRTDAAAGLVARTPGGAPLTRVEALAHLSSALLTDQVLRQPRAAAVLPWGLLGLVGLYLALVLPRLVGATALALSSLLAVALLLGSHVLVRVIHLWWPVAMPVGVLLLGTALMLALRWRQQSWAARSTLPPSTLLQTADESLSEPPTEVLNPLQLVPGVDPEPMAGSAVTSSDMMRFAVETAPTSRWSRGTDHKSTSAHAGDPQTLPMEYVPSVMPEPETVRPDARLPRLAHFHLLRELGRGTMGRVYLARDVNTGREVALKTLALTQEFEGYALQEARERFQREAQAAARLHHPDIVSLLESGEEGGLAYIAMERLSGPDLSGHVHPGNLLPAAEVVHIGARVADALAHAHAQGVIHRDIKPANVMIDPALDQVKVTDFGVARLHDASRTRTGLVLGSPAYMSPEQLVGRVVDGRSDLYSLGVLLFQMLTGELPVAGQSMGELMQAVAHQPAPNLRSLRPDLPEALADVLSILLEKRPELRYRDGAELAADLRLIGAMLEPPKPDERAADFQPTVIQGTSVQEVAAFAAAPAPQAPNAVTMRAQSST